MFSIIILFTCSNCTDGHSRKGQNRQRKDVSKVEVVGWAENWWVWGVVEMVAVRLSKYALPKQTKNTPSTTKPTTKTNPQEQNKKNSTYNFSPQWGTAD